MMFDVDLSKYVKRDQKSACMKKTDFTSAAECFYGGINAINGKASR